MKMDIEGKEREIVSYQKTIEALTDELDGLRTRVRDLEQAKQENSRERGSPTCNTTNGIQKEVVKELEQAKQEKEEYKQLLINEEKKVMIFDTNVQNNIIIYL